MPRANHSIEHSVCDMKHTFFFKAQLFWFQCFIAKMGPGKKLMLELQKGIFKAEIKKTNLLANNRKNNQRTELKLKYS